jgi:hypothetical protein
MQKFLLLLAVSLEITLPLAQIMVQNFSQIMIQSTKRLVIKDSVTLWVIGFHPEERGLLFDGVGIAHLLSEIATHIYWGHAQSTKVQNLWH